MKNRFMLAPLTNRQSYEDGRISQEEFHWLTMRAQGGFGLTMTCASHVQAIGKGFPGQLGIWSDEHIAGLTRLVGATHSHKSIAISQLHHAGMRSPKEIIGEAAVCPSNDEKTGARALSCSEVKQLIEDFISAAVRAENLGLTAWNCMAPIAIFCVNFSVPKSIDVMMSTGAILKTVRAYCSKLSMAFAADAVRISYWESDCPQNDSV